MSFPLFEGFQAQFGSGGSPQRIGASQQPDVQFVHVPQKQQQMGFKAHQRHQQTTAAEALQRITQEYNQEAARIAEQLSLCGVQQQCLGHDAQQSLKLLAQLSCALHVTQASPAVLVAAWTMLLVQHSRALTLQHKLQREVASLAEKRRAAQQKLAALQRVLAEVQAAQGKELAQAARKAKDTRQMQVKDASYKSQISRLANKLEKAGFRPELKHSALVEKDQQLQALQQELAGLMQQLNRYHQLPTSLLGARMKLQEARKQLEEKQERFQSRLADA